MKKSGPRKTYKGKIDPLSLKNPQKYQGDLNNIIYRSMWERNMVYWLDLNPSIVSYASEEFFFPYENPITGKRSKYFPDFYVKLADGTTKIIEVKPQNQIDKPKEPKRKTQKYQNDLATWIINQEKWKSAKYLCEKSDANFEVWSEIKLKELGILKDFTQKKQISKKTNRKSWPKRKS